MPPINDNIANRQVLSGASGSITPFTIDDATDEVGEVVGSDIVRAVQTVWFAWTAPTDAVAVFDTLGSVATDGNGDPSGGLDTTLAAWAATDPTDFTTFTEVASDDDDPTLSGTHYTSRISFLAATGTTYLIQLGTFNTPYTGTAHLNWSSTPYSPDGPGNDECAHAIELTGRAGHRDAETAGWAGVWPTGADPIFEQFGHGGQPLWWKYTNAGATPVQFKAVFGPSPVADVSATGLYAALMVGACGSLAVDLAAAHLIKTAGAVNPNAAGTVDVIVQPGDTVFLEVEIDAHTSEPPGPPANGRTAYSFVWTVLPVSTRDCMTGQTALADVLATQASGGAGTRAHDSILVGDRVYVAYQLDYNAGGDHNTARVASVNTDGTGYTEAIVSDLAFRELASYPGKTEVEGAGGGFTSGTDVAVLDGTMFLAYDGHDVLLAVLTKEGFFSASLVAPGQINYYVDIYREDGGSWTNIATLISEDLRFQAINEDSFESFRIAASPAGPRKLWVGWIYAYIDRATGRPTDRFTRYEIDTSTGAVSTLYDDFDDGGGGAAAIEDVSAVGTAHWWIEADEGYPILLWQKHSGFDTLEGSPAYNGRSGWDGFLTAERFDTKALIQEIHRGDFTNNPATLPFQGPGTPTVTDGLPLAHDSGATAFQVLRTGDSLKMFGRFFCGETGQYERFISLRGWTTFYDSSGDFVTSLRNLARIKSDLTGSPEQIDSAAFNKTPGINTIAGFTVGARDAFAVTTPLYDGVRNVWTIGDKLSGGASTMFQYDRRCAHDWLAAMDAAADTWEGDLWQRGGWDTDLYFYVLGNDLQIWKLGPVERDCSYCIPPATVAGLKHHRHRLGVA